MITDTKTLKSHCETLAKHPYITVDTEFLRDKTYYARLCLVQLCAKGMDPVAVDPLANGIDLQPLFDLMADTSTIKVFHAARQDLEIFFQICGALPTPLFDTQVAAMVCGYGDQIGYLNLVKDVCGIALDKGAQFTDWSRRPLSEKQLSYALDDVTYLRDAYESLAKRLEQQKRTQWVLQEMEVLNDTRIYEMEPNEAWRRIKVRTNKPKVLGVLKAIAAWREREAQRMNIPRPRVIRDDALADMAIHPPRNRDDLQKMRNVPPDISKSRKGEDVLKAVQQGLADPNPPKPPPKKRFPQDSIPVLEMMKMLLKIQAGIHDVAPRLVASIDDLEELAQIEGTALLEKSDLKLLKGWRFDVFGKEALAMKRGDIALSLQNGKIVKIDLKK